MVCAKGGGNFTKSLTIPLVPLKIEYVDSGRVVETVGAGEEPNLDC